GLRDEHPGLQRLLLHVEDHATRQALQRPRRARVVADVEPLRRSRVDDVGIAKIHDDRGDWPGEALIRRLPQLRPGDGLEQPIRGGVHDVRVSRVEREFRGVRNDVLRESVLRERPGIAAVYGLEDAVLEDAGTDAGSVEEEHVGPSRIDGNAADILLAEYERNPDVPRLPRASTVRALVDAFPGTEIGRPRQLRIVGEDEGYDRAQAWRRSNTEPLVRADETGVSERRAKDSLVEVRRT